MQTDEWIGENVDALQGGPNTARPAAASAGHRQRAAWARAASATVSQSESQRDELVRQRVALAILSRIPTAYITTAHIADLTGLSAGVAERVLSEIEATGVLLRIDANHVALGPVAGEALLQEVSR